MKTNLKRISKRSLALILGILMLCSTLMVGTITNVNAALTASTTPVTDGCNRIFITNNKVCVFTLIFRVGFTAYHFRFND